MAYSFDGKHGALYQFVDHFIEKMCTHDHSSIPLGNQTLSTHVEKKNLLLFPLYSLSPAVPPPI